MPMQERKEKINPLLFFIFFSGLVFAFLHESWQTSTQLYSRRELQLHRQSRTRTKTPHSFQTLHRIGDRCQVHYTSYIISFDGISLNESYCKIRKVKLKRQICTLLQSDFLFCNEGEGAKRRATVKRLSGSRIHEYIIDLFILRHVQCA